MFCLSAVMPRKVKSIGWPLSSEVVCFASVDLSAFEVPAWFAELAGVLFDTVCCLAEQLASNKAAKTKDNVLISVLLLMRRTFGYDKRLFLHVGMWLAGHYDNRLRVKVYCSSSLVARRTRIVESAGCAGVLIDDGYTARPPTSGRKLPFSS